MSSEMKSNSEFLTFITVQVSKGKFENLKLLTSLEKKYPQIFTKVMSKFDEVKVYRKCLDEKGKPINVEWKDAMIKFYLDNKYEGITNENADIAKMFSKQGLSQDIFDDACELRQMAKSQQVSSNILDEPIREETILESIEKLKKGTEEELKNNQALIKELYGKQFSYEWLSKNDPANSIIGLYCSCCASITNPYYGKDIVRASVLSPEVQNLVIRNSNGEIIAKGTMYVNKENGYAVINDFELNETYKHHELEETEITVAHNGRKSGRYNVSPTSKEEQERGKIFETFQKGLQAFVEKYDKVNPDKPLRQINVGMGYNKLKRQVERFEKETKNLTVPVDYEFQDATEEEQYILYKREKIQKENGGIDR